MLLLATSDRAKRSAGQGANPVAGEASTETRLPGVPEHVMCAVLLRRGVGIQSSLASTVKRDGSYDEPAPA